MLFICPVPAMAALSLVWAWVLWPKCRPLTNCGKMSVFLENSDGMNDKQLWWVSSSGLTRIYNLGAKPEHQRRWGRGQWGGSL